MYAFKKIVATAVMLGGGWGLQAQEALQDVATQARQDLDEALQELSATRERIRESSVPLSRRINALKAETRSLRAELEREQRAQDSRSLGIDALEARVSAINEENEYLSGLMNQFQVELHTQTTAAEQQNLESEFAEARDTLESPETSPQEKYSAQIDLVRIGFDRLEKRLGGVIYEGEAVGSDGTIVAGKFVELGPVSVFAGEAGQLAGIIEAHDRAVPRATPLHAEFAASAAAVAKDGRGSMPLDVTLGSALAIEGSKETVLEHVRKGGLWVWPILGFALLATLLAIFKIATIYRIKQPSAVQLGRVIRLVREGKKSEATQEANKLPWEFGPMIQEAVACSDQEKELVEEVMYEKMLEAQPKVERFLSVIAVTAAVAPLLGLLGTVTGMINTFKMITLFGTGDASSLSGGISEALITTELGLVVAIPALIAHALLNRKAQAIMASMEQMAVVFVNGLPGRKEPRGEMAHS